MEDGETPHYKVIKSILLLYFHISNTYNGNVRQRRDKNRFIPILMVFLLYSLILERKEDNRWQKLYRWKKPFNSFVAIRA